MSIGKFETKDTNFGALVALIGIFLMLLGGTLLITRLMDRFLNQTLSIGREMPSPLSPLHPLPPEPRLQVNPAEDLIRMRDVENVTLNNYAWVDSDKGIVRIPIERAMAILAERGLPAKKGRPMKFCVMSPRRKSGPSLTMHWIPAFAGMTVFLFLASLARASSPAHQNDMLKKVGFTQNLDAQIPLNLSFQDETGRTVPLSIYFGKKPVLLNLVYFQCPMLCTEVLNGTIRTLRAIPLKVGQDFNVVTVSFDSRETSKMAAAKKRVYLDRYGHPGSETGWAFLTGTDPSIQALADSVGFHFAYDKDIDQFAHASGIIILTPEGRVSHYFYGVEYPTQDVRLSLVEASHGKIGSPVDQLLLYCYHYDPATGRYGLVIMRVLRVAGLATFLLLATFVITMLLRERADRMTKRNA